MIALVLLGAQAGAALAKPSSDSSDTPAARGFSDGNRLPGGPNKGFSDGN